MEVIFLNNVNLTDCFISTLKGGLTAFLLGLIVFIGCSRDLTASRLKIDSNMPNKLRYN